MRKQKPILFLVAGIILMIFLCLILGIVVSSQDFEDFVLLRRRNNPHAIAVAFATALRLNDKTAYELADKDLWPRLDEWMKNHQVKDCKHDLDEILHWGEDVRFIIDFVCYLEDGGVYTFVVRDIIIHDGNIVVDWGEVSEEVGQ